jgi:predicted small integral membrane protein
MANQVLRTTKVLLIVAVVFWGFIGALFNVLHWGGTMGAVGAVTSMATWEGGADSWQATSNVAVIWAGALFITLSKIIAGTLCAIGASKMWQTRRSTAASFGSAKKLALAGCGFAMLMLFGGFIVIGESWFELWRSDAMRGPVLESAFRYGGMITLIALFVGMEND